MPASRKPTILLLILDAVGIKTLEYLLANHSGEIRLPNLISLGLGNLLNPQFHDRIPPNPPNSQAQFAYAIQQASADADSVIGHREMVGVIDPRSYGLFFQGFPDEYLKELTRRTGKRFIFNQMAGGMEAIEKNRKIHEDDPDHPIIIYASKCDPLPQFAAREDLVSPEELTRITDLAFEVAIEQGLKITRAISRPYLIKDGEIVRTAKRHDKVLPLENPTLLDLFHEKGIYVSSVGKPAELIPAAWKAKIKLAEKQELDSFEELRFVHEKEKDTNPYSIQGAINELRQARTENRLTGSAIIVNCVDGDTLYGHTQQVEGTLKSVQEIDRCLPLLLKELSEGDIFIVTADHGMEHRGDYGHHSKEPLPFLAKKIGGELTGFQPASGGKTLADVGYFVAQQFGLEKDFVERCGLERFYSR